MNEVTLRYTEPLVREAVRAFVVRALWRGLGWRFLVALVGLAAGTAFLIATGDRSWIVGSFGATLMFFAVIVLIVYLAHHRNTVGRFRRMRNPEATLSYDDEHFTISSETGSATMPWSSITEVWRFPRFWLLLFSPSQFVTLPLACLDVNTQAFIMRMTEGSRRVA